MVPWVGGNDQPGGWKEEASSMRRSFSTWVIRLACAYMTTAAPVGLLGEATDEIKEQQRKKFPVL